VRVSRMCRRPVPRAPHRKPKKKKEQIGKMENGRIKKEGRGRAQLQSTIPFPQPPHPYFPSHLFFFLLFLFSPYAPAIPPSLPSFLPSPSNQLVWTPPPSITHFLPGHAQNKAERNKTKTHTHRTLRGHIARSWY
jgi:hypothetical protein